MQQVYDAMKAYLQGKKVAFIGAGVSHKQCIEQFVEMGAKVTLCDKKPDLEAFGEYADTIRRLGISLSLGENYMEGFKGQDIIILYPRFAAGHCRRHRVHQRNGNVL